jgi:DNA-directed RNA polymerase II subunit RPB2
MNSTIIQEDMSSDKEMNELFDIENEPYIETPWHIIESYFKGQQLERFVRHQLESYNNFVSYQITKTIEMFNPVHIASEQDFDPVSKKYALEIFITFENFKIYRPQIHENNGAIKLMFPQEARLRNFTYSASTTININVKYIVRNGINLENTQIFHKTLPDVHIGKLPIMLKSNICVLTQYKHFDNSQTGECKYDAGGYFIINGSEKTVLGQERAAENRVYCFNVEKNETKYLWKAEIKSVPDFKCISPKQISMMILSKNNGFGYPIVLEIPRVKQPIPLFIVFRALGVITDKEICEKILLDLNDIKNKDMLEGLQGSVIDSDKYLTQEDCIKYITSFVMYTPINMDKETGAKKKYEFTLDILNNDLFPHCHNLQQKIYFLGYMTNKLLMAYYEIIKADDRDSYLNKRVDLTGTLLNNLYRNYFNKLVKDMEKQVVREINTGSWRSKDDYENIINLTNIYKIIKSSTIENGIKRALSTGDFGIKHSNSNKVGVAQVYNRLNYVSSLSHARRISTPTDKSGKLIPPRKLHNTCWGFCCPSETPEGQSVGVVKNLAYMTHVTVYSNSLPLYEYIMPNIISIDSSELNPNNIYDKVKVFINGTWVGITEKPMELYYFLKDKKYKGIINIYTSIVFDYKLKEIRVCNDSGRLTRPLLRVKNKNILINNSIIEKLKSGELSWDNLLTVSKLNDSILEYIDPEEQSWSMIATKPKDLINANNKLIKFTHCEIHPSTIFGVLASCIPFPEHNQSPRVTYQCAQGKQAMGIYATNYENRMDKTAYILNYPMRPLVETRIMDLINLNNIPSGSQLIVAIMTHTGYNQEDSLLVNKGSIDRGMALVTVYHTEKDEDKQKINGDEEIRCKPDKTKTKGNKMGNYNKVNSKGVIPENTLVENRDVIIAKVTPIKENRNDHTKVIKFEDQSKIYKTNEETYIDKNYIDRNGDGYTFAKVRLRSVRKPVIGDKFCALPTQQVLTNIGWIEIKDIDIENHKLATLDINGNMIYEHPIAKFEYEHNDKMYFIQNKQVHIICTLNHKLYVNKRSSDKYELIKAKDVMGKAVRFQKSLKNIYPDIEFMELGDEKYSMDYFLRLLGMFIADGSTDKNNKRIFITALKQRKRDFNEIIFQNLGVNYSYQKDGNYYISSKNNNLYEYLNKLSVGCKNKYLPDFVFELSERQSKILLESLLEGDGSKMEYKGESFDRYGTISLRLANDVTRLAVHCGYSAIIKIAEEPTGIARVGKRNLGSRAGQTVEITQKHTYYKVSIITKQNQPWINKKKNETNVEKLIDYEGKVYCIEMPSSHLYYMRETNLSPSLLIGNSSRHGQKGTVGNIIPECDMPYTDTGIRPDIIINPHAIPSRMTIGQLKETVLGKVLVELGLFGDGTSFGEFDVKDICDLLLKAGYEAHGNELLYDGLTGEQIECSIFMGPVFYQRLKHMVNDKVHSRSIGPMVNLTRQPAEGRSRDGGLRFGEMERDCVCGDTQIATTNGLSVLIKNMSSCDFEVLGWDERTDKMVPSKQIGFLYKGERECIKLTFEDGRTQIYTPEHPILNSNGQWIKAKDLEINERIKTSVTFPVADFIEEIKICDRWNLQVGDLLFETNNIENYKKSLIFAKLLGYLITDGSIQFRNGTYNGTVFLGHMNDVNSFVKDLKFICDTKQTKYKHRNLYEVRIPSDLIRNIVKLDGFLIGKKVIQPAKLPEFILEPNCPLPIIREFLGGLFGGDGHTCVLGMHRGKRDILTSISFSQTKNKLHLESLTKMMEDIKKLLTRFDIYKVTIQKFKETTYSKEKSLKDENDKNYQLTLHLHIDEVIKFHEKIGFRYCCHKSQRLEAGVSYKRLRNEVARQHNWIINRVNEITNFKEIKTKNPRQIIHTKEAINQAVEELKKNECIIHEYSIPNTHDLTDHLIKGTKFGSFRSSNFPTAEEYLKQIGAYEWFLKEQETINIDNIDNNEDKCVNKENICYGVSRDIEGIPTMNLKVIDIRSIGSYPVYDIEVENTHSFLANGIVSHNCMVSHGAARFTRGRMYDASDKYSVHVCKKCGLIAAYNDKLHIHICNTCDNRTNFAYVEIPYACKLLFQELNTMNIAPRIITEN